jgi:hypothetical protein
MPNAQLHDRQHIGELDQGLRLAPFPTGQLTITVLPVEKFLQAVMERRWQAKSPPVSGQVNLDKQRTWHDSLHANSTFGSAM